MSGNREVLRNSAFRRLFWSRAISNVGNGVAPIALAFGVLALPGTTPTSLSIVLAARRSLWCSCCPSEESSPIGSDALE